MRDKIINGDTLTVLREMAAESVDCIITSPPYFGLRDYGKEVNVIWDDPGDCEHKFDKEIIIPASGGVPKCETNVGTWKQQQIDGAFALKGKSRKSQFCSKCGAWYGQLGLEPTLELYLKHMLQITAELKRMLKKTGTMFWNHGDCYGGSQGRGEGIGNSHGERISQKAPMTKCLMLQNYRLILKMIDEQGWILRNDIKWHKPNSMPSSVKDRWNNTYEPIFFFSKSQKYWFDLDSVRVPHETDEGRPPGVVRARLFNYRVRDAEKKHDQCPQFKASEEEIGKYYKNIGGNASKEKLDKKEVKSYPDWYCNAAGKNPGDTWTIPTQPYSESHFATFPEKLIIPMIKAGCPAEICKKCGKARARITEQAHKGATQFGAGTSKYKGQRETQGDLKTDGYQGKTIGWTDCGCNAGFQPGIVLDPFFGAGTTGVVAKKLNRNFIGIELNPEYCKMAQARLRKEIGILYGDFEIISAGDKDK